MTDHHRPGQYLLGSDIPAGRHYCYDHSELSGCCKAVDKLEIVVAVEIVDEFVGAANHGMRDSAVGARIDVDVRLCYGFLASSPEFGMQ